MKILNKITLISALMAVGCSTAVIKKTDMSIEATQVAPGLYMLSGVGGFTGGNIGLSVGDDGVVMIDDSMPPMLDMMKTAIKTVTQKPVDFLINTHVHGDHTGNNEAMGKSGTRIVAHENLRKHFLSKGVQTQNGMQPAPEAALPVITFSHSMNFHLNGENAHIFHVANAHTDGDAVIHFKTSNVIHTGDTLFNGMFPYIDLKSGGSLQGYIAAQKKTMLLANDKTKIIPGHGPLANKNDLVASIAMLEDVKKIMSQLVAENKTEAEVMELNPLQKYHEKWNWGFITTEKMTRQAYQSISQSNQHSHENSNAGKLHSH